MKSSLVILLMLMVGVAFADTPDPIGEQMAAGMTNDPTNVQIYNDEGVPTVLLINEINDVYGHYAAALRLIYTAPAGSELHIIIANNGGGSVMTMLRIQDAIMKSKAHISMAWVGFNASAAATLLCTPGVDKYLSTKGALLFHQCHGETLEDTAMCQREFIKPELDQCVKDQMLTQDQADAVLIRDEQLVVPNATHIATPTNGKTPLRTNYGLSYSPAV
jgi:hypothetical protein